MPRASRIAPSSGPPFGSSPASASSAEARSPLSTRGASQPRPQARRLIEARCRQRLAVGGHRGVVTDRRQRVCPQRQQRGLRLAADVVTNGFGPAQHLCVEPGCRRDPRRLQRVRSGHSRLAPGEEKVGDLRRSGTKIDESRRDLVHDRGPQSRGDLRRQPGSDGRIRESIRARLGVDHSGAERLLQQPASFLRVVAEGRGELEPVETISELRDPLEGSGHLGGQTDHLVLVHLWPAAIGLLDDLEAGPPPGVWPLSDDDGQSVRTGQPGHIVNEEKGFTMSEVQVVEQEHRARLLRGGDEELAHCYEPILTRRGQLSVERSLEFGPASGRDRIEQSGIARAISLRTSAMHR